MRTQFHFPLSILPFLFPFIIDSISFSERQFPVPDLSPPTKGSSALIMTNCQPQITGLPSGPICPNDTFTVSICHTDTFELTIYGSDVNNLVLSDLVGTVFPVYPDTMRYLDSFCLNPLNTGLPECLGHVVSAPQFYIDQTNVSGLYCVDVVFEIDTCGLDTFDLSFHMITDSCDFNDPDTYVDHQLITGGGINIFGENPNINPAAPIVNEICTGDGPFFFELDCFCDVTTSQNISWVYRDDPGAAWIPAGFPDATCFTTVSIDLDSCTNSNTIVKNRQYGVSIKDPATQDSCFYQTDLQICCPVVLTNLGGEIIIGSDTTSITTKICSDDFPATLNLHVGSNKDLAPLVPGLVIDWEINIDGTPINTAPFQNMDSITVNVPTANNNIYVKAILTNTLCNLCNQDSRETLILIEQAPSCGMIVGPDTLCPLDYTTLELVGHNNCTPHWYMSDDPTFTGNVVALGISNELQNTNILPPETWTASIIYYQVICKPDENSTCEPCTTATHEIHLLSEPDIPLIITTPPVSNPPQSCGGDLITFSITNLNTSLYDYTWYHNGAVAGTGPDLQSDEDGCFWVVAQYKPSVINNSHLCGSSKSEKICIDHCDVIPIINFPSCVTELSTSFTIDASSSYSTCGFPIYSYLWSNSATTPSITINGPFTAGTIYNFSVVVTDSLGCSETGLAKVSICGTQ